MKVLVRIELVVDSNKDVVQQITDAVKNVVESNPNTIEVAYARAFPCSLASKSCDQADEADDNKRDHSEMEVKRVAVKEAVKRRTIKRIAIMHASAARLDEIHAALNRPALPELLGLFRALPLGRPIPAIAVPNDRYPRHRQIYRIVKAALVSHNDISAAFEVTKKYTWVTRDLVLETLAFAARGFLYLDGPSASTFSSHQEKIQEEEEDWDGEVLIPEKTAVKARLEE